MPRCSASRSSSPRSAKATPPWDFVARIVVTSTAALGREPAEPAHDVAELLEAEVAREPGLGDDVVGELQRHAVLDDRVVRVRDVAERPRVHQRGLALERLHEVRLHRVLHDHRHRAGDLQLLGGDGPAVVGGGHHDAAHPRAEVLQVAREGEDRHDLGGRHDHPRVLARDAVHLAAEADHRVAELAVVHVQRAGPRDRAGVDAERVAVVDAGVERRGQEVVRGLHGVEVAVEVQVDLLHRHDLRVAAAVAAALDAPDRTHAGLAQAEHDVRADAARGPA